MSAGVMLALFLAAQELASGDGKLTIAKSLRGQKRSQPPLLHSGQ